MLGQGVVRECVLDDGVDLVKTIDRRATWTLYPKMRSVLNTNFREFSAIEAELTGLHACFFCLGVSAVGATEAEYEQVTHRITMAAAETLVRLNPQMTFICISGAGTDSSEKAVL